MTHTIYSTAAHAIEANFTAVQPSLASAIKDSKTRLFAHWELIDHQLVCKWLLAE